MTGFADCCRAWDLKVSTSEVIDCARHLALTDLGNEAEVKQVIWANFAKSRRDQKKLKQVFQLFFHDIPINTRLDTDNTQTKKTAEKIFEPLQENADTPFEQSLIEFISSKPASFLKQVRTLHIKEEKKKQPYKSNLDQLTGKLEMMLMISRTRQRAMTLIDTENTSEADRQSLGRHISDSLKAAQNLLSNEAGYYNDSLKQVKKIESNRDSLVQTPFSSLTPKQIQLMQASIDQLVRKLKDQVARRHCVKNKGVLDIKKTLRAAGKYQGVPVRLKFKDKALKKSNIVTLCDVSGSVWSTAKFMLHLLYSLQDCFTKVRSFVFVSQLAEVTSFFDTDKVNQAVEAAMTKADINYHDQTDYGVALQAFKQECLAQVNRKTTLIILGDGRSNYQNPQANILGEFREKTKRIIWLNPEPAATWYTGDSEIRNYQAHCHSLYTCMNLEQLKTIIRDLVL